MAKRSNEVARMLQEFQETAANLNRCGVMSDADLAHVRASVLRTTPAGKQKKAAAVSQSEIRHVTKPGVSDVVNKKTAKFKIDTLVEMLSRVGKPVRLAIG
jgi:predicted XRE-type DNA-binding protein